MPRRVLFVGTAVLLLAAGPTSPTEPWAPEPIEASGAYARAIEAIEREHFRLADALLTRVVESEPENADAFNMLGYANRRLGRIERALEHYTRALEIAPNHLLALEYMGEAYLAAGRRDDASDLLARIRALCPGGCREYVLLEEAIRLYDLAER